MFNIITFKFNRSEITLKMYYNDAKSNGVVSFDCLGNRAFYDRYDNMIFNSEKEYIKKVNYFKNKALQCN